MNPTSYSSSSMLNRKRRPSDDDNPKSKRDKNFREHSINYYNKDQRKEDGEHVTSSENIKKFEIFKARERDHLEYRDKERNKNRDDRGHFIMKEKSERREKTYNHRRDSFSRKDEENFPFEYEVLQNRNKNYEIREDYDNRKNNRKRNYNEIIGEEKHSQNHSYIPEYNKVKERRSRYHNSNFEDQRNARHESIKREDNRYRRSGFEISNKRRHDEEKATSYRHSYSMDRNREDDNKYRHDESLDREDHPDKEKRFNFLIILPRNYFRIIEEDYDYIIGEIKKRVRDLKLFQYDYKISGFNEFVLRIDASILGSKVTAMRIVCGVLFEAMKKTYHNMSYLKLSILVPSHVVGFIIGIEGKNINSVRDMTDTRIDVFQNDINNKYRQIELQGSPENISKAGEKIYKIVNKYYFFDNSNRRNGDENSPSEEHGEYRVSKYEEHEDNATSNMRRPRIRLGNRNDRKKNRIEERRDVQEDRNNQSSSYKKKERKRSRRSVRKSPTHQINSESLSKSVIPIQNLDKEINQSDIYPSSSNININAINTVTPFTQSHLISENISNNMDILNITQSNLVENPDIVNYQLTKETKSSSISIQSNNNNLSNTTETIFSGEIQKIEEKLEQLEKYSEDQKVPLNLIITNQNLNTLKNVKSNIFIEIENKYHCSISKKVEKLSDIEVNILTLYGTPEQNCLAVYYLQQIMSGKRDAKETS